MKWWGFGFFRLLRRIYDSPRNDEVERNLLLQGFYFDFLDSCFARIAIEVMAVVLWIIFV